MTTTELTPNPNHWLTYDSATTYTGSSRRTLERLVADNRVRIIRRPHSRPSVYLAVDDLDAAFKPAAT